MQLSNALSGFIDGGVVVPASGLAQRKSEKVVVKTNDASQ